MNSKILKIIVLMLTMFLAKDVLAYQTYNGTFYEAEKINGVYFYKHRNDTEEEKFEYHNFHSQATVYRKTTDNNIVYCIESWAPIRGALNQDHLNTETNRPTYLSLSVAKRIEALAYYGYGYKDENYDHTDSKWYAITQYLIWQIQAPNIEHYFVSSISSTNPIYPFEDEIAELNYIVDKNMKAPSFKDYENIKNLYLEESITLTDTNDVLGNYRALLSSDKITLKRISNNEFIITARATGTYFLYLTRSFRHYSKSYSYYQSDKYQDMFEPGNIDLKSIGFEFHGQEKIENPKDEISESGGDSNDNESSKEETPDETNSPEVGDKEEETTDVDKETTEEDPKENVNQNPTEVGDSNGNDKEENEETSNSKEDEDNNSTEKEDIKEDNKTEVPSTSEEDSKHEIPEEPENKEDPSDVDKETTENEDNKSNVGDESPEESDSKNDEDKEETKEEENSSNGEMPNEGNQNKEDLPKDELIDETNSKEEIKGEMNKSEEEIPDKDENAKEDSERPNIPEQADKNLENTNNEKSDEGTQEFINIPKDDATSNLTHPEDPVISDNKEETEKGDTSRDENFLSSQEDTNNLNKNEILSIEAEQIDNEINIKNLDNEPVEVEVPATDANAFSLIFYILSAIGLLKIRNAK